MCATGTYKVSLILVPSLNFGGKVEGNESLQEALEREIREEVECAIIVGELLLTVDHSYPDFNIRMHCFLCSASDKKFTLNEHINARWLTPKKCLIWIGLKLISR